MCLAHLVALEGAPAASGDGNGVASIPSLGSLPPYPPHIRKQNHIHQQCIDDGRNGHFAAVEDER